MQCAQLVDGIKYTDASLIFTGKMSKIKKGLRESFSRDVSIYYYAIFSIVFLKLTIVTKSVKSMNSSLGFLKVSAL